jgi:hypothetical protein
MFLLYNGTTSLFFRIPELGPEGILVGAVLPFPSSFRVCSLIDCCKKGRSLPEPHHFSRTPATGSRCFFTPITPNPATPTPTPTTSANTMAPMRGCNLPGGLSRGAWANRLCVRGGVRARARGRARAPCARLGRAMNRPPHPTPRPSVRARSRDACAHTPPSRAHAPSACSLTKVPPGRGSQARPEASHAGRGPARTRIAEALSWPGPGRLAWPVGPGWRAAARWGRWDALARNVWAGLVRAGLVRARPGQCGLY